MIGKKVKYTSGASQTTGTIFDKCYRCGSDFYLIKNENGKVESVFCERIIDIIDEVNEPKIEVNYVYDDYTDLLQRDGLKDDYNELQKKYDTLVISNAEYAEANNLLKSKIDVYIHAIDELAKEYDDKLKEKDDIIREQGKLITEKQNVLNMWIIKYSL